MGLNFATLGPNEKVTFRGHRMDARDAAMHLEAERRFGATVPITQGGYNPGGVTASGGAHDKSGALDWSLWGMSAKKKRKWDRAVKDTGWCAWHRRYIAGLWPEHEHGVARGCKNLAPVAAAQIPAFDARLDGLVSGYADPSYRPDPKVEFDYAEWKRKWIARRKITRLADQIRAAKRQIAGLRRKVGTWAAEKREAQARLH
jgi:hypothetical protein